MGRRAQQLQKTRVAGSNLLSETTEGSLPRGAGSAGAGRAQLWQRFVSESLRSEITQRQYMVLLTDHDAHAFSMQAVLSVCWLPICKPLKAIGATKVSAELDPEADAELGLPDMVGQYHSIYPLEDVAQVSNLCKTHVKTTRHKP
jgi:hypothetical protein